MNSPIGCETLPPAPAAVPGLVMPASSEEGHGTLSFEALLEEETSPVETDIPEEGDEDDEDDAPPASANGTLPFFASPFLLLAQALIPSTTTAKPDGADASTTAPPIPASAGTIPAQPVENKLPPEIEPVEGTSEQIAEKGPVLASKSHGMFAAQGPSMVFTNSNQEDGAAAAEKLPLGIEYIDSPEHQLSLETVQPREKNPAAERVESLSDQPISASSNRMAPDISVAEFLAVEEASPAVLKMTDEISGHVQLLRTSGQDRLEVVLKPDGMTQLHLQVTKADGMIHVQARCERGDFAALDAQWTNVQSLLAAHGIRVEPLQPSLTWDNNAPGRHASQERPPQNPARPEYNFEQDQPSRTPASPSAKPAAWQSRGWQRWA